MKVTRIKTQEFTSANILEATVEHNGICGGDSGHGGYVKMTFKDLASTDMSLNGVPVGEFTITIRGDCERDTFIDAFSMIVKELKENR